MNKILFTINPHSIIDVITNSSSELFVNDLLAKDTLIQLIKEIYPDYLNEYQELKTASELTCDELQTYLNYRYIYWSNAKQEEIYEKLPGFSQEEMDGLYDGYGIAVTEYNKEKILNAIDPNKIMCFLFSLDENPNWEFQDKLMNIMSRYHLG